MASSEDEDMYNPHDDDGDEEMAGSDDDDDMNGEDPEAHDGTGTVGKNNSGQHKKSLDARATNAEIMALNETTLLFKGNLFKLQEDELLAETSVTAGSKATRGLDAALRQIRDAIEAQDAVGEMGVHAAAKYVRKISKAATGKQLAIPFPDPAPSDDMLIRLGFQPPTVVNIVGSYPLGMAVNNTRMGFNVDMVVQMPAALFQDRDHLNFRYFYKRAFYVAVLFVGLQQSALRDVFDMEIEYVHGDRRLPIVAMRPQKGVKHLAKIGCVVRVLPSIAHDTLPLKRLAPGRNH
ncbi:U3 snoRNP protein, partial [Coemansia sp. RSA 2559]